MNDPTRPSAAQGRTDIRVHEADFDVGHEIAHGLQDMYFDLAKLQEPILHRSDAESARRFLIEGEAQAAYLTWVSGEGGVASIDDGVLDAMGNQVLQLAGLASPFPVLARSLQMPYADGTATVLRLVQRKGWGAIDDLYRALPESTEQTTRSESVIAFDTGSGSGPELPMQVVQP